jgi:hypothetical protein
VRSLLADESGRSWLGGLAALSLAVPVGAESTLLLQATSDLEALGLRVERIEHVTTTIAVLLRRSDHEAAVAAPLSEQLVDAYVRAATEATEASDAADRARRDEALALAQPRADTGGGLLRIVVPRGERGRWARAVRHPVIATRWALGRVKRRLA